MIFFSSRLQEMAINSYDIVSTLQALGMMKYWKGKHIILKKQVRRATSSHNRSTPISAPNRQRTELLRKNMRNMMFRLIQYLFGSL
jgi:hypothetical protein